MALTLVSVALHHAGGQACVNSRAKPKEPRALQRSRGRTASSPFLLSPWSTDMAGMSSAL